MASQPGIECVVVDYGCPDGAADWVEARFPGVKVVRVKGVDGFNASHARNLGAQHASSPWLAFFDADILLAEDFFAKAAPLLAPGHYYRPDSVTLQTWGSFIGHREDFRRAGGYDESYAGWGGEDDDLFAMFGLLGVQPAGFPAAWVGEIAHDDELRTRYAAVKDRRMQSRMNQFYLGVKLDFIRLNGKWLERNDAAAVFSQIQQIVVRAESAGQASYHVDIAFPPQVVPSCAQDRKIDLAEVTRTIRYAVRIVGEVPGPGS